MAKNRNSTKKTKNKNSDEGRTSRGTFASGNTFGPGRPPGCRNKINLDVRECFLRAFDRVGGEDYLVKFAHRSPKEFVRALSKLLPQVSEIIVQTEAERSQWLLESLGPDRERLRAEMPKVIALLEASAAEAEMITIEATNQNQFRLNSSASTLARSEYPVIRLPFTCSLQSRPLTHLDRTASARRLVRASVHLA